MVPARSATQPRRRAYLTCHPAVQSFACPVASILTVGKAFALVPKEMAVAHNLVVPGIFVPMVSLARSLTPGCPSSVCPKMARVGCLVNSMTTVPKTLPVQTSTVREKVVGHTAIHVTQCPVQRASNVPAQQAGKCVCKSAASKRVMQARRVLLVTNAMVAFVVTRIRPFRCVLGLAKWPMTVKHRVAGRVPNLETAFADAIASARQVAFVTTLLTTNKAGSGLVSPKKKVCWPVLRNLPAAAVQVANLA